MAYSSTNVADNQAKDAFYAQLHNELCRHDITIILGDMNATVGRVATLDSESHSAELGWTNHRLLAASLCLSLRRNTPDNKKLHTPQYTHCYSIEVANHVGLDLKKNKNPEFYQNTKDRFRFIVCMKI